MTVREFVMHLLMNTDLEDTVEIECFDKDADCEHRFSSMKPKHVTRLLETDVNTALIECEKED